MTELKQKGGEYFRDLSIERKKILFYLHFVLSEDMDKINMGDDTVLWGFLVNTVRNVRVLYKAREFLSTVSAFRFLEFCSK